MKEVRNRRKKIAGHSIEWRDITGEDGTVAEIPVLVVSADDLAGVMGSISIKSVTVVKLLRDSDGYGVIKESDISTVEEYTRGEEGYELRSTNLGWSGAIQEVSASGDKDDDTREGDEGDSDVDTASQESSSNQGSSSDTPESNSAHISNDSSNVSGWFVETKIEEYGFVIYCNDVIN